MDRQKGRGTTYHHRGEFTYLTLLDMDHTEISGEIVSMGEKCLELFVPVSERSSIYKLMSDTVIGESMRLDVYLGELLGFYVGIPYPYIKESVRVEENQLMVIY